MRKTIPGTGGMLLLQTLKDAGVEYLFTNPGSAETGIFAALAESEEHRLVVGKHEGLVAAMADGYHRLSGKVGVVIAHVMGGSHQLARQLFNAPNAGSPLPVLARGWASQLPDYPGLAPERRPRPCVWPSCCTRPCSPPGRSSSTSPTGTRCTAACIRSPTTS